MRLNKENFDKIKIDELAQSIKKWLNSTTYCNKKDLDNYLLVAGEDGGQRKVLILRFFQLCYCPMILIKMRFL